MHYGTQDNKAILRPAALIQPLPFHNLLEMIQDSGMGKRLTNGSPLGGEGVLICALAYSCGMNNPNIVNFEIPV